jgi:hypothetical protein
LQNSKKLTMQGIELLLDNCENLGSLKYLENCDKINEFQFRQFKQRVKESIK